MPPIALESGKRAERKTLITVAEWSEGGEQKREILGTRTEDSSIEFNADIETTTDIRGITYSDINKTEPQQDFDPYYILGGSDLGAFMHRNALRNNITAYSDAFDVYVITAYDYTTTGTGASATTSYFAVKHAHCSIIPTSMGGDAYVNMPIEVHFSNDITVGSVDKLTDDFVFTAES